MEKIPALFRKRLIPFECIELKDDVVLRCDDEMIVTRWTVLHPKKDLRAGYSCYYLKEGFKVSAFLGDENRLLYWYCDIVDCVFSEDGSAMTATDLLADVVVEPDGSYRILDLDEMAFAHDTGLLSADFLSKCLRRLHALLTFIYEGRFAELTAPIEEYRN